MSDISTEPHLQSTAIRTRLRALGLDAALAEIDRMTAFHSLDVILRALDAAGANAGAKRFVENLLGEVRKAFTVDKPGSASEVRIERLTPFPLSDSGTSNGGEPNRRHPRLRLVPRTTPVSASWLSPSPVRPGGAVFRGTPGAPAPTLVSVTSAADSPGEIPTLGIGPVAELPPLRLYGEHAAMVMESCRNAESKAVICIEAAAATAGGNCDWARKISLVLTPAELLYVLAVVMNYLPYTRGKGHAPDRDTFFDIAHQGDNLFAKIGNAETVLALSLGPADALALGALVTTQVRKNIPSGAPPDLPWLIAQALPMLSVVPP